MNQVLALSYLSRRNIQNKNSNFSPYPRSTYDTHFENIKDDGLYCMDRMNGQRKCNEENAANTQEIANRIMHDTNNNVSTELDQMQDTQDNNSSNAMMVA
jgi:hypothetical protein